MAPKDLKNFPLPRRNPPEMRTSYADVVMSPRAARFYTWLRDCGIHLTSFSTDDCVKRELANLQRAHAALLRMMLSGDGEDLPELIIEQVIGDLETLMRRVPENRVPATNKGRW